MTIKNLKPFDLEAAKRGDPVCTRNGNKARIISFDSKSIYSIIALILDEEDEEEPHSFTENGHYIEDDDNHEFDLMMTQKTKKLWIAVAKNTNHADNYSTSGFACEDLNDLKRHFNQEYFNFFEIEIWNHRAAIK